MYAATKVQNRSHNRYHTHVSYTLNLFTMPNLNLVTITQRKSADLAHRLKNMSFPSFNQLFDRLFLGNTGLLDLQRAPILILRHSFYTQYFIWNKVNDDNRVIFPIIELPVPFNHLFLLLNTQNSIH